ncbi:uncharacterized protein N0V89_010153 [Didymosphaeria variabile]|uniref:Uncharacterized protein n=1 Tax=Didymosphaeria variabile TaxID=1932322 RepID=A0A9W8XF58_9PLEO|nr:uncharacterized protein N0V89_010153 [Didymosphaeria variabile]KAJ4348775.1 hypothetical protein N0V89_010153 [Didymosphaeria variabile]
MSSNRPFFSNFLAAFRAQSAIQKAASSQSAAAASSYTHSASTPQNANQNTSRQITTKAGPPSPGATTAAVQATGQFQPTRQHAAPYHRSTSPAQTKAFPIPGASARSRRGSDSSSEGFHEAMGAEKWYIGGRTAAGEEKFYKLGMVKRHRSVDRLSLDRLSI